MRFLLDTVAWERQLKENIRYSIIYGSDLGKDVLDRHPPDVYPQDQNSAKAAVGVEAMRGRPGDPHQ